jgi:hypothetical protein
LLRFICFPIGFIGARPHGNIRQILTATAAKKATALFMRHCTMATNNLIKQQSTTTEMIQQNAIELDLKLITQ